MKKANIYELPMNPFQMIGKEWALVTAKSGDKVNAMTVSWGGAGIMWGKPVVTIYLRPQRYTKEFVDAEETFTLTFFGGECKKEMMYLGRVSGRDEDKMSKCGLTLTEVDGYPTFEGATVTLVCKKLYKDAIHPESFLDPTLDAANYAAKDYHALYICEVMEAYIAE